MLNLVRRVDGHMRDEVALRWESGKVLSSGGRGASYTWKEAVGGNHYRLSSRDRWIEGEYESGEYLSRSD